MNELSLHMRDAMQRCMPSGPASLTFDEPISLSLCDEVEACDLSGHYFWLLHSADLI